MQSGDMVDYCSKNLNYVNNFSSLLESQIRSFNSICTFFFESRRFWPFFGSFQSFCLLTVNQIWFIWSFQQKKASPGKPSNEQNLWKILKDMLSEYNLKFGWNSCFLSLFHLSSRITLGLLLACWPQASVSGQRTEWPGGPM